MILETINSPADVKRLSEEDAARLCQELRRFLVEQVSRTGGHLASNLGVVELTVAIHRVYDTASDRLVLDVGHQCYVHKALTGRRELFGTLRQFGGLSGFPKPYESVHDAFMAGHASDSVSVALGMARARTLLGAEYQVAAVIGDGVRRVRPTLTSTRQLLRIIRQAVLPQAVQTPVRRAAMAKAPNQPAALPARTILATALNSPRID